IGRHSSTPGNLTDDIRQFLTMPRLEPRPRSCSRMRNNCSDESSKKSCYELEACTDFLPLPVWAMILNFTPLPLGQRLWTRSIHSDNNWRSPKGNRITRWPIMSHPETQAAMIMSGLLRWRQALGWMSCAGNMKEITTTIRQSWRRPWRIVWPKHLRNICTSGEGQIGATGRSNDSPMKI